MKAGWYRVPEVVTLADNAFLRSTLTLGHRLSIEVFRSYVVVLNIVIAFEVIHHAVSLRLGDCDTRLRLARTGITLATIVLTAIMLADMRLYTGYTSLNGFRLIVLIALVGHIIGLIGEVVDSAKGRGSRPARSVHWPYRLSQSDVDFMSMPTNPSRVSRTRSTSVPSYVRQ